jgi:recombination protein RecR
MYPKSFKKLIDNFASLPSVGPKMAERLVLYLSKLDKEKIRNFSESLLAILALKSCPKCFNIAEEGLCEICKDSRRDKAVVCVVEEPLDIFSIEKTGIFKGLYHVLGGVLQTTVNGENKDLKIPQLLKRIEAEKIKEVIIATNPTTEGDITALYLKKKLAPLEVTVTRLARGLSTGGDIEYVDDITLSSAFSNRKEIV